MVFGRFADRLAELRTKVKSKAFAKAVAEAEALQQHEDAAEAMLVASMPPQPQTEDDGYERTISERCSNPPPT